MTRLPLRPSSRPPLVAVPDDGATSGDDVVLTLPARAEHVTLVRHVLGALAEGLRLPRELIEDVRLAATEACTNVVRHAYAPGVAGTIRVTVRPTPSGLAMTVSDRGCGIGPSPDGSGPGLGLPLISAVAESVEFSELPGGGSRVSMVFGAGRSAA